MDTRNIVYADEEDPLDLYRTILKLDDRRQSVFEKTGGSMLILSPFGSKVMALGALMAALERDLPVAHLEPIGYELKAPVPESHRPTESSFMFGWKGEVYPATPTGVADGREPHTMTTVARPKVFGTGLIALDLVISSNSETPVRSWAGGYLWQRVVHPGVSRVGCLPDRTNERRCGIRSPCVLT